MPEDIHAKAVDTWNAAAPPPRDPAEQAAYNHWSATQASQAFAESQQWKWGWNGWIGIHYGPIPVGIIIVVPLMIAMWASK